MNEDRGRRFVEGVLREIKMVAAMQRARGIPTPSGYFGGGTPTALPVAQLVRIVEACFGHFAVEPKGELTIEANPDTVDSEALRTLRATGINRISFGVQSFNERLLATLGRTHGRDGAIRAIEQAEAAGFSNRAIDLIYRVPGQSIQEWEDDLKLSISLGIDHISTYCLFLDPGTRLYNDTLAGNVSAYPDETVEIAMYGRAQEILSAAGYRQYTINDFAKPGRESEHHLTNWQAPQRSYVGLGPGAFGFLRSSVGSFVYCTQHSLGEYLASVEEDRLPVRLANRLTEEEELARYLVLGLRCLSVPVEAFRTKFGLDILERFSEPLARLSNWGLICFDEHRIWMTDKGKHYASNVLKAFYTGTNRGKPQPIGVELLAGTGLSMVSVNTQPS